MQWNRGFRKTALPGWFSSGFCLQYQFCYTDRQYLYRFGNVRGFSIILCQLYTYSSFWAWELGSFIWVRFSSKHPNTAPSLQRLTQVWVLTRTRLEITLSCWMSLNNRLEASKGGWCLESLFFLCQTWLLVRKHIPSSLLCTKRASQAMILLPVRLHLNLPFIRSSRTSRRAVQLLWRRLQGAQESPANTRTVT